MRKFITVALVAIALSACTPPPNVDGSPITSAQKVAANVRSGCAAWPVIDGGLRGIMSSKIVKLPADAGKWEGETNAVVSGACKKFSDADAAGKTLDLTTLQGILDVVSGATMAIADYIHGAENP